MRTRILKLGSPSSLQGFNILIELRIIVASWISSTLVSSMEHSTTFVSSTNPSQAMSNTILPVSSSPWTVAAFEGGPHLVAFHHYHWGLGFRVFKSLHK
jgi:hypothetical protein